MFAAKLAPCHRELNALVIRALWAWIAEHGGRIVKTMGDGLLLEFASVVDATQV